MLKVETPKMHVKLQLLMLSTKVPLHAPNYVESFIKSSGESYK